jgi:hypothetical protein
MTTHNVLVSGSFDDVRSKHLRFLEEAARLGQVQVLVWDDEAVRAVTGQPPRFPLAEAFPAAGLALRRSGRSARPVDRDTPQVDTQPRCGRAGG